MAPPDTKMVGHHSFVLKERPAVAHCAAVFVPGDVHALRIRLDPPIAGTARYDACISSSLLIAPG
jgi:hypothetical protein